MGLGKLVLAPVVRPHVTIDVQKAHQVAILVCPELGQARDEGTGPLAKAQLVQLPAQRLHLRCTVQPEHTAELPRSMRRELLGTTQPQERHECQRDQDGVEAEIAVLEPPVDRVSNAEKSLCHEHRKRQQNPRLGHTRRRLELGCRLDQLAPARQGSVQMPLDRHTACGGLIRRGPLRRSEEWWRLGRSGLRGRTRLFEPPLAERLADRTLADPDAGGHGGVGSAPIQLCLRLRETRSGQLVRRLRAGLPGGKARDPLGLRPAPSPPNQRALHTECLRQNLDLHATRNLRIRQDHCSHPHPLGIPVANVEDRAPGIEEGHHALRTTVGEPLTDDLRPTRQQCQLPLPDHVLAPVCVARNNTS